MKCKKNLFLKNICNCFLVGLFVYKIKEKILYLVIKKYRGLYMLLFCYKIMLYFQFFISKVFCVILYSCYKVLQKDLYDSLFGLCLLYGLNLK